MPAISFNRPVRPHGGSLVVSLPPELLLAVGIKDGDMLVLTASDDGISMRKADGKEKSG